MAVDIIDYKIFGDDMQCVEIELDPGEGVRAEAGAMMLMEGGIEMQTGAEGGIFKGFKRMLTGEIFFITNFLEKRPRQIPCLLWGTIPGKIIPLHSDQLGGTFCVKRFLPLRCQRHRH